MNKTLLQSLDYFFLVFHSVLIVFNSTGWIFKKTRKIHLFSLGITAFSWFILGYFYGWGYCFCTEWHWQVREALGRPVRSWSYIHFLVTELTGVNIDPGLVDTVTLTGFTAVIIISVLIRFTTMIRDARQKKIHY